MSCSGTSGCLCGCCGGTSVQTPQAETNRPGLSAISYRAGTWAAFKESMLARLSSSDYPALNGLKTRDDDDFTISYLDATAVVLDILTFYQERMANESYLRTATQPRSLVELSRLIAYVPAPGVAASTYLAFTLKTTPGLPINPSSPAITISAGTQVQSIPAQGQTPQTFETSADIQAKPDWNALGVQATQPWAPQSTDQSIYLAGVSTQLQPGDLVLVVGDERLNSAASSSPGTTWNILNVVSAAVDKQNNRTLVILSAPLGISLLAPPADHPTFHVFRQRAALFGYNAMDPSLLNLGQLTSPPTNISKGDWKFQPPTTYPSPIDLDSVYPKIVPGGWVALASPNVCSGIYSLYNASSVSTVVRSDYGLTAKISRINADTPSEICDFYFHTRSTAAFVQSEMLPSAPQPLTFPLYGNVLDLAGFRTDLDSVQFVALSGTQQKIAITNPNPSPQSPLSPALYFYPDYDPNSGGVLLNFGDVFTLTDPASLPPLAFLPGDSASSPLGSSPLDSPLSSPPTASQQIPPWSSVSSLPIPSLCVQDANGRTGTIKNISLSQFELAPSASNDPVVSEYALVVPGSVAAADTGYPHTQMQLVNPLTYCYDRTTTTVNANVGPATQGQSVTEILGSGSASTPNQSFTLKQSPLTFVQSQTSLTGQSTLKVNVNSAPWTEVPSLYNQSPASPVFATLNQADGTTDVIFGDGVEGAVLPTGQNNVQATYRFGSGLAGIVPAGTLATLLDRPLGVSGVTNPQDASGGANAQSPDQIRANAPQAVLTLGRVVSITDYQNVAGNYSGIAKAQAIWLPIGPDLGVFLTVAGPSGAAVSSVTVNNLVCALRSCGNPLVPISVNPSQNNTFTFQANLKYAPGYDQTVVQIQVIASLKAAFSFDARTFGQCVSADEITAVIQGIPGIVAVVVTSLVRTIPISSPISTSQSSACAAGPAEICAYIPIPYAQAPTPAAEILTLDPNFSANSFGLML